MQAETPFERNILERLHQSGGSVKIKSGATTGTHWPPDHARTNVVLVLPDPNDWGK